MRDYEEYSRMEVQGRAFENNGHVESTLCSRCKYGVVLQRKDVLTVDVYCSDMHRTVPSDLARCSSFADKRSMSLDEMQDLALKVDVRVGVNDKSYI